MSDTGYNGDINENCRLCGLQSFEVLSDKSADSLGKIEDCTCFVKTVIAFLHEQILGCKENDESTKPKVSLSLNNEFLKSQTFEDLRKQHDYLMRKFTDLPAYSIQPLDAEFKPVNTVHFEYVQTKKELIAVLDDLLKCCEIAVNLEYYFIRSYLGFTWLLQISTTKTNYFVDCLKLETELHILNEVFMSINILKIFYKGKDSVLRLKKDFGIYVTNIFDINSIENTLTAIQERELLQNPVFSFLDPKHTYLLLYVKAYLTSLLFKLEKSKVLTSVRKQSKKICDQVYKEPEWNDMSVLQKVRPGRVTSQKVYIVRQLLIWRNETAKKENVALKFILPDEKIVKCAKELLKRGFSETFNRYSNGEFLVNGKVELNINGIIETAKTYDTKKVSIAICLSNNTKSWEKPPGLHHAQEKSNSQPSKKESSSESIKNCKKTVITVDSSSVKIPKQKVIKINKSFSVKTDVKKPNPRLLLKVLKPQLRFKDLVDNSSQIWKPGIIEKPNRLVPLQLDIVKHGSKSRYYHPYKTELQHFIVPRSQLVRNTPIPFHKTNETSSHVVKTLEDLISLSKKLINYNEIAVDLKYNKNRSYQGYTSLLLISTRDSDYIIDALSLRSNLQILNTIFTDPKILKVFHNSANKLVWLQKDLSLYVVNMFDVARTNMMFNKKILSLANLRRFLCDIKKKELKQIELPQVQKDWRVRPLSFDVKHYLRYETHFLLYIKDILSNELYDTSNLLKRYYDYCTNLCKNVYQKPIPKINCYKNILNKKYVKNKYAGHMVRIRVMKELNRLRHMIARQDDESPNDVISEEVLLKLVDLLPRDQWKISDLWDYDKKKIHVSKVTRIISSAKNFEIKVEKDDDYHYIFEAENDLKEMVEHTLQSGIKYYPQTSNLTLKDFICSNEVDETATYNPAHTRNINDNTMSSFILIKGYRWDETKNIGNWLKKWIGKKWTGNYYVKPLSDSVLLINLFLKKYKDIIWQKRNQIHYEEGAFIQNPLGQKNREIQHRLTNIAKDLRSNGIQVKIRELTIKIEDKWYELKEAGLQETSAEELRKRGVDTDV